MTSLLQSHPDVANVHLPKLHPIMVVGMILHILHILYLLYVEFDVCTVDVFSHSSIFVLPVRQEMVPFLYKSVGKVVGFFFSSQ